MAEVVKKVLRIDMTSIEQNGKVVQYGDYPRGSKARENMKCLLSKLTELYGNAWLPMI